jgi:GH43 family beta-xylosidase
MRTLGVVLVTGCLLAACGEGDAPAGASSNDVDAGEVDAAGPVSNDGGAGGTDAHALPEAGADAAKGEVKFPAYAGDFPDPYVLRDGATYHAYATNVSIFVTKLHIPHIASTDLVTWSSPTDALPTIGSWAEDGYFNWAPGVLKTAAGGFVLFYADKKAGTGTVGGGGEQCLGRATSAKAEGPFVDGFGAPLVCSSAGYWAIDPTPFKASNGKTYLLWRQDKPGSPTAVNHVVLRELDASGTQFAAGSTEVDLLARDQAWETPVLENPAMVEIAGKVFLFYSANDWETGNYGIGYATCASVTGPCTKVTNAGPWFGSIFAIAGPGGEDFFTDPSGGLWMSYHTWVAPKIGYASGGARVLALARVGLDTTGKPVVQKGTLP